MDDDTCDMEGGGTGVGRGRKVESTQNSPEVQANAQLPLWEGQGRWPQPPGVRWAPQG